MSETIRAIALLSGGLDSTLAARLVMEQGVDLVSLNFVSIFCTCTRGCGEGRASGEDGKPCRHEARLTAEELGLPFVVRPSTREMIEAVKHPRFGYGKNMNPCLDCRAGMLRRARELMPEFGARFLVTGEVLGQRPMSQRLDAMRRIERDAGVEGLVLRPLSSKHLPPTIPEREGWVDRAKLLGIRGRSRRPQMSLAEAFHVKGYACPAGGCLLTDPSFGRKIKELLEHDPDFSVNDTHLLKFGRHFRLDPATKAVVGRVERENAHVRALAREGDALLCATAGSSPDTLLRGDASDANLRAAAALTARYSKWRDESEVEIGVEWPRSERAPLALRVAPIGDAEAGRLAIGWA